MRKPCEEIGWRKIIGTHLMKLGQDRFVAIRKYFLVCFERVTPISNPCVWRLEMSWDGWVKRLRERFGRGVGDSRSLAGRSAIVLHPNCPSVADITLRLRPPEAGKKLQN
jgi:hypothetical protein